MLKKDISDFWCLTKRDMKVFLKDKGSLLCSLITPVVLVVLYMTFLKGVYEDSLLSILKNFGIETISSKLLHGFSSSLLLSSILATSCVTMTFCSNTIVVDDKNKGCIQDIEAAPVKRIVISLSYFASNCISTLAVSGIALVLGFLYIAISGWFLSALDVLFLLLAVILITLFGSLFASILMSFMKSQGAVTACSITISSLYGFICGAYMPISSFSKGVANVCYALPGTYGTMILRHFLMSGVLDALGKELGTAIGAENALKATDALGKGFDIRIEAYGNKVSVSTAFLIIGLTVVGLLLAYSLLVFLKGREGKNRSTLLRNTAK